MKFIVFAFVIILLANISQTNAIKQIHQDSNFGDQNNIQQGENEILSINNK